MNRNSCAKQGDLARFLRERHIEYPGTVTEGDLEAARILNDLLRSAAITPSLSREGTFQLDFRADRLAVETALALGSEIVATRKSAVENLRRPPVRGSVHRSIQKPEPAVLRHALFQPVQRRRLSQAVGSTEGKGEKVRPPTLIWVTEPVLQKDVVMINRQRADLPLFIKK